MSFTSAAFALFLAVIVPLYHVCPRHHRATCLLVASLLFYSTWSVPCAVLLVLATATIFLLAQWIDAAPTPAGRSRLVTLAVLLLLFYLGLFKYALGLMHPLERLVSRVSLPDELLRFGIVLPLGVSYYTFKLMGYVVDVYWGKMRAARRFTPFAASVAFFPQIVAGPIQRCEALLPQLERPEELTSERVVSGLRRILLGAFKKLVVADNLAVMVDYVFAQPHGLAGAPLLFGSYLFAMQLYADFSGLTDIAIGVARLFGIQSPENFDAPFLATNISEFWRRWHMTLTGWLTDYVFTPLRMATRNAGSWGLALSLSANMIGIGLWHGARWTYLAFGALNAVYLITYALTLRSRSRFFRAHPGWQPPARVVGLLLTFHAVVAAFVFFRANSLGDAGYILSHWLSRPAHAPGDLMAVIAAAGARRGLILGCAGYAVMEAADLLRRRDLAGRLLAGAPRWGRWALYYAVILAIITWRPEAHQFIYFKF